MWIDGMIKSTHNNWHRWISVDTGVPDPLYNCVYHISIEPLSFQPFFLCLLYLNLGRVHLYAIFPIFYLKKCSFVCALPKILVPRGRSIRGTSRRKIRLQPSETGFQQQPLTQAVWGQEFYHLSSLQRLQECTFFRGNSYSYGTSTSLENKRVACHFIFPSKHKLFIQRLVRYWTNVLDAGPILNQPRVNV